jgi:hypothetical protein
VTTNPSVSNERSAWLGLLVELIKAALTSDEAYAAGCRERGLSARDRIGDLSQRPAGLWDEAVRHAGSDPDVIRREVVNPVLPAACPIDLSRLAAADFDFAGTARLIRESSASG